MFIESRWNRNPELAVPDAIIVGFDTGIARIMEDQPIIQRNYQVEDARRVSLSGSSSKQLILPCLKFMDELVWTFRLREVNRR
jgi:hypothetical protein